MTSNAPDAAERLAALCAVALPAEHLRASEIERICFQQAAGTDVAVLGDAHAAAVVATRAAHGIRSSWILLLAVHPDHQGQGRGRALVDDAIAWARQVGAADVQVGNLTPRYIWPGLDYRYAPALALFETAGFEIVGPAHDMAISTAFRARPPAGVTVERETTVAASQFSAEHYPQWVEEVDIATPQGTCFVARAGDETIAFACHSVWRRTWMGPFATHPERRAHGTGRAVLSAMCADLERAGSTEANICWVGPTAFYAKAGATVSRVYRTLRLGL
ncbi:MAG: GNAT family N-acetyltransferase [Acidimicrobiia bacterium]